MQILVFCTDKCLGPYHGGCPKRFRVCNQEPLDGDVCAECLPGYISEYDSGRCYREFLGVVKLHLQDTFWFSIVYILLHREHITPHVMAKIVHIK